MGVEFPEYQEDVNIIGNNSGSQQQRQGWNQQQWLTYQGKYLGNNYNSFNPKQSSLRDLILEKLGLMRIFIKSLLLMIRS